MIIDASSPWARAEKQLLTMYERVTKQPILTVLNRVEGNYVDVPGRADAMKLPQSAEDAVPSRRKVS